MLEIISQKVWKVITCWSIKWGLFLPCLKYEPLSRELGIIEFGFEFEFELDFELDFELGFELDFELDF